MHVGATVAGRYRLVELLGQGGMGEVWRATDEVLRRTVAVKVVLPALHAEAEFGPRFLAEARAMAKVHHPGVVAIYDFGEIDNRIAFLVMEFVAGEPLSRMLHRLGRLSPATTMDLITQAAQALEAVHDRGIVHRDVKPGNLIVRTGGAIALTDFGIAAGHTTTSLTTPGMILGTLSYLAPEQIMGEPATARSDVYALGLVAYECLTGQRPFTAEAPVAAALQRVQQPAPPLPADIPSPITAVVTRALATDPAHRWQTAAELADAAKQALIDITPVNQPEPLAAPEPLAPPDSLATPDSPDTGPSVRSHRAPDAAARPRRRSRRRRLATVAAAAAVLLTVATVTLWITAIGDHLPSGGPPGAQGAQRTGPPTPDASGTTSLNATPTGATRSGSVPVSGSPGPGGVPGPGATEGPSARVTVAGPGDRTSTAGTAISPVNHTASGGAAPYSWSASGLPAGLSINSSSGAISGSPTGAQRYTVTVTATDSSSPAQTGNVSYSWTVNTPPPRTCSGTNDTDIRVPDYQYAYSASIRISSCAVNAPTTAKIEVHIKCPDRGALYVELYSPMGFYKLYDRTGSGADLDQTFTKSLNSEEVTNGSWWLYVSDNRSDGEGATIDSWTLTLT